jgi:dipeptidyl aminopeptidase/acylaminoacyl peptidase
MNGIKPIDAIKNIHNKDLPILIICSQEDTLVPWTSSYRLYTECLKQAFTNVRLFIAKHGGHCRISSGASKDEYKQVMTDFCKHHQLV